MRFGNPARPWTPGDAMLHPLILVAISVLLLNDHVFKERWPGAMTGKLSDIAGLAFFPILLFSLLEVGWAVTRRPGRPSGRGLLVCLTVTACAFASSELVPFAERALETMFGWARWTMDPSAGSPTVLTRDPTDLLALPALSVAAAIGLRRIRSKPGPANRRTT